MAIEIVYAIGGLYCKDSGFPIVLQGFPAICACSAFGAVWAYRIHDTAVAIDSSEGAFCGAFARVLEVF